LLAIDSENIRKVLWRFRIFLEGKRGDSKGRDKF
jgi:hypothetical protein